MKKKLRVMSIFCISICINIIGASGVNASFLKEQDLRLKINNSYVLYSNQQLPYSDSSGRTLLPLRLVGDVMGATVSWNTMEEKATAIIDKNVISFILGQQTATVNGQQKQLDSKAVSKNNTIMIPARFMSEEFGIKIDYDKKTGVVHLSDSRLLSSDKLTHIDEMQRVNDEFNGSIIPFNVSFIEDKKNSENNKLVIKVSNNSSLTVKKGQLNRNTIFYASDNKIGFIGSRGLISPDGSTGYNMTDINSESTYIDSINWDSIKTVQGAPLRYIFCNFFITVS